MKFQQCQLKSRVYSDLAPSRCNSREKTLRAMGLFPVQYWEQDFHTSAHSRAIFLEVCGNGIHSCSSALNCGVLVALGAWIPCRRFFTKLENIIPAWMPARKPPSSRSIKDPTEGRNASRVELGSSLMSGSRELPCSMGIGSKNPILLIWTTLANS